MKITIEIPDSALPDIERIMAETGAKDFNTLFFRAVSVYLYLFRLLHRGMRLAVLNFELEIEGHLIDLRLFSRLFRNEESGSATPPNEEN
ncbi:hypothetical protein HZC53_03710 [Candidatus Uhrbacteria bacterium]|nr:hypothetical protein [Candidatus Uhrbacteria bacterium]